MSISFRCPGCGANHKVRDEFAGKKVKCKCGQAFQLPASANKQAAKAAQASPGADANAPEAKPAETTSFQCPECGKQYKVSDTLAGQQAQCKCGAVVQVPAATVEAPDPSFGDFLDEALAEPDASVPAQDPLSEDLSAANGPILRPVATAPRKEQRTRVKIEFASGGTLRLIALLLIAVDVVQSGIWEFPAILSGPVLKQLLTSFWGWMTLTGLGAHVGLIVGGIGILRGQEFGRNCVGASAVILLSVTAVGFLRMLPHLGAVSSFIGVGWFVGLLFRGIAIPLGIAICVFHPAWED